jgi:hypothetical protein
MTIKEALEKIRTMVFADMPNDPVAPTDQAPAPNANKDAAFVDYKTKDGVVVSIDKLEVGGQVVANGVPAADGELVLEDGTKLSISGGVISELEIGEEVAPVAEEQPMMKQDQKILGNKFSEIEQSFQSHKEDVSKIKTTIDSQAETIKQMFSLLEKIANTSIEKPIEKTKSFDEMTPLEKFRATKNSF